LKPTQGEPCIRKRVIIDGQHYYIIQSKNKVQITVPHENWPERQKERLSVDILCQEVLNISNEGKV